MIQGIQAPEPEVKENEINLPNVPPAAEAVTLPKTSPVAHKAQRHRLDDLRPCSQIDNKAPATEWNANVHYYSNVPAETDGLFASSRTGISGVFDLGFAHNKALNDNIRSTGNYWKALRATADSGYKNGEMSVSDSITNPLNKAVSIFSAGKLPSIELSVPFSGTQVYPLAPETLRPTHHDYKKMAVALDPKTMTRLKTRIFQVHLTSGYASAAEKTAWQDDARQLDRAMQRTYGALYSSEESDPRLAKDTSFGAFATYLYKKAESLPPGSVLVVGMFGHGNKSLEIVPSTDPKRSIEGVHVGTFAWGDPEKRLGFPNVERTSVNEWEMRQLLNSLPQKLQIIAQGHQCLGGQMNKGERVSPRHIAPANRD